MKCFKNMLYLYIEPPEAPSITVSCQLEGMCTVRYVSPARIWSIVQTYRIMVRSIDYYLHTHRITAPANSSHSPPIIVKRGINYEFGVEAINCAGASVSTVTIKVPGN